jgi:phosphoribosylformylglycinamidine synthase II
VIYRLEIASKESLPDPLGEHVTKQAKTFLSLSVRSVRTVRVLKVDADISAETAETLRQALTDPVSEQSALGALPLPPCDWVVTIGFKPGVTDNVGRTARVFLSDLLAADAKGRVFTEQQYLLDAPQLSEDQVQTLADSLLYNALIERCQIKRRQQMDGAEPDLSVPRAGDASEPIAEPIALPDSDEQLLALSRERTLALSLAEMRAIRDHHGASDVAARRAQQGLPEHPTDVELEAIAQTWSEHCKHKIFNAAIDYTDEHGHRQRITSLFKTYIVGSTKAIAEKVDWLVSVFHDNAGVVRLDDEDNIVFKVETHNSPSALDPYGGSITGIVGVNRDPFGTGMGAELLTNTWGYCLGSPFFDEPLPEGLHHPRRIRDGVHHGVIDGGNQSGIPYSRGFEVFDSRFIGKPLVFCGTVGVMPKEIGGLPSERKEVEPGDVVVMVGGRIGKDGIHGATFSSEELRKESPAQAVQIGDPITQKMMTEMLLEARDRGLYRAITDNGAGGLSSSVGEMAEYSGGAELDLALAPLKYSGLMPWEILLSEAQERMTLAVAPEKLDELLALAERREVEATAIGQFTDDGYFRLKHGETTVGELSMDFLHGGCPLLELEAVWPADANRDQQAELREKLAGEDVVTLLRALPARLDLCSKESKSRQYDHEVKGLSVVKPLCGKRADVVSDATVLRARHGKNAGVILAEAIAPRLSDVDPGLMTRWVVDLALRRIIAAGGKLGRVAALDNFCWPDPVQSERTPDGHRKLAGLVRSCQALDEMTRGLTLPLISGKDSMKNDSVRGGVKISIPPTLLLSAMGWIDDVSEALDLQTHQSSALVYLIGETAAELGGSQLHALLSERDGQPWPQGQAPIVDIERCKAACRAVQSAHEQKLLLAAHAVAHGGLAFALTELALAADFGFSVDLAKVPQAATNDTSQNASDHALLFSESASRFIVTVARKDGDALEKTLAAAGAPFAAIGQAVEEPTLTLTRGDTKVADLPLDELRRAYSEPLRDL